MGLCTHLTSLVVFQSKKYMHTEYDRMIDFYSAFTSPDKYALNSIVL